MDRDWLGTQYVAVVKDCRDQSQDRMHLDCVFNITGFDSCLMLEDVMQTSSPIHRLVDEYKLDPITRRYHCLAQDIEFSAYVQSKGYQIIPVSREEQLRYACNVLNLGNGTILSADAEASRKMVRSPFFHGRVEVCPFSAKCLGMDHGYGRRLSSPLLPRCTVPYIAVHKC